MQNTDALGSVIEKIALCRRCSLYKNAGHAVPGEGNPQAKIFFIGEAPGYYEDQTGRPFVGPAGKLLERTLEKVGLQRQEVFIGNVIKHRPPENRDPLPTEITACALWLDQQLAIVRPKIIVTLGRFSMAKFLPGAKISSVHGVPKRVREYIVIPMYHPAAALRSQGLMSEFTEDFVRNQGLLSNPDLEITLESDNSDADPNQGSLF
ncbi:MAG TPA: uracil-DNA glycosylase [Candidatus Nanoarchaeia archaeon]